MNLKLSLIIILQVLFLVQCQDMSSSTTEKEGLIEDTSGSSMASPIPGSEENQSDSKPEEPEDSKDTNDSKEQPQDSKDEEVQADEAPPAQNDQVLNNIPVTVPSSSSTFAPTRPASAVSSTTPPPLVHNADQDQMGKDMKDKAINTPVPKEKNAAASDKFRQSMVWMAVGSVIASLALRF